MQPSDPRRALAGEWLVRAGLDLRMARLAAGDTSLSGLASFHCQQAAEKALKAFLASRDQTIARTHDLPALLVRCGRLDSTFDELHQAADTLDVYLAAGRYPDAPPDPSPEEASEAVRLAEMVVLFVEARLA